MSKPIPKLRRKPGVRKKRKKISDLASVQIVGFDISLSSVAAASIAYHKTLRAWKGPEFLMVRWNKDDHYFDRITEVGQGQNFIWELQAALGITVEPEHVFIAQEEPWPPGRNIVRGGSQSLKQQAEISGAFLSGLLKSGFKNIFQIGAWQWKQIVAEDLGITIHHSKYGKGVEGKMRSKEWALSCQGYGWQHTYPNEIPEWPDLISRGGAMMPRPEGSKAKAVQPDDRYDALAIMEWMVQERNRGQPVESEGEV